MLSKIFIIGCTLLTAVSASNIRSSGAVENSAEQAPHTVGPCSKCDNDDKACLDLCMAKDSNTAFDETNSEWGCDWACTKAKAKQLKERMKHKHRQEQERKKKREQKVKRALAKAAKWIADKKAAAAKWIADKKAFLGTSAKLIASAIKYGTMCGFLSDQMNSCNAKTAGIYFPQANFPEATSYDGILKYSELMLAFVNAGYKFKGEIGNTPPQSRAILKSLGTLKLSHEMEKPALKPSEMCKLSAGTTNLDGSDPFVEIKSWSHQSKHDDGELDWTGHDTQSSTYEIEFDDEYLMVYQLRGSENPDFDFSDGLQSAKKTKENAASIVQDWLGSDFEVTPADDEICKKAGVKIHSGFQKAYKSQRVEAIAYIKKRLQEIKAQTTKTVKLFVTGHSLGAAQASLAAYDFHCNKHFKDSVGDHVYLITQGQPVLYHGDVSLKAYQSTVPATHRIRQMAVSAVTIKGNTFTVGDMVGMSFPAAEYNQPGDDFLGLEVQPRDINGDQTLGYDCHPQTQIQNGIFCHFLDRYNEGLASRPDTYEGICAATTPESQKNCDYCK